MIKVILDNSADLYDWIMGLLVEYTIKRTYMGTCLPLFHIADNPTNFTDFE